MPKIHFRVLFALTCGFLPVLAAQSEAPISVVQQRIEAAEKTVHANPSSWQPYNDLAFALCRKARDNGDISLYDQAEKALQHSRQLSADNYDAQKLEVVVLLGKHEFTQALKLAAELNKKVRDDIAGWALLVDTNVAIGNYNEAEKAAQWILDLRPGSALGFEKAAGLREIFGDAEGAIEFFEETNRRTSQNDTDQRAWLLTQMARLELTTGNSKRAEELLSQALKLFPDSQLALAALAKTQMAEGNYPEAVSLFEKRYKAMPTTTKLYDWASALDKAGMKAEASAAFSEFESRASKDIAKSYNENLTLISYFTDYKENPGEALRLAANESHARQDLGTLDAYAWALYGNARYDEAKTQLDRALAVGVRDPVYFCHAAHIAMKTNDAAALARFTGELKSFGPQACPLEQPTQAAREVAP